MPKLAANVSMMFGEVAFLDRFEAAARCGFKGAEFLFPYAENAEELGRAVHESGLTNVLFNLPPGDADAGDRGLAGMPGREGEFREALAMALHYAQATGCKRLHAMHGIPGPSMEPDECRRVLVENLRFASQQASPLGVTILVEALNPRDVPGYPLNRQHDAFEVVQSVARENVRVQFDMYHCQIVEGDVATTFRELFPWVGHVQIAGVPGRHEPSIGEVRYEYLLPMLDEVGYEGWVGCEYRPVAGTAHGLDWAAPYGVGPSC